MDKPYPRQYAFLVGLAAMLAAAGPTAAADDRAEATDTVAFSNVPPGSSATYEKDGESVTVDCKDNQPYPVDAEITLGRRGSLQIRTHGGAATAIVRGDRGAVFTLAGTTSIGGVVVGVPEDESNVQLIIGGAVRTVVAGTTSLPAGYGTVAATTSESEWPDALKALYDEKTELIVLDVLPFAMPPRLPLLTSRDVEAEEP